MSSIDEKTEKAEQVDSIEKSSSSVLSEKPQTESERLDALEHLEIIPQILQEGIVFGGSGSALLLQAAMPGIRSEEDVHNDNLATELGDALQAFISYITCLTFGTRHERKTLMDLLQRGQPPLKGSYYYSAKPEMQLWIAATLYATSTDFYQRIYGRVSYRVAKNGYKEFTLVMNCLGIPTGTWPETRHAFWKYWDDQIEKLHVTPNAHKFATDLLNDTSMPRWVQWMKPLLRVLTIEMLPPRIRKDYGLKSTASTRGLYRTTMGFSVAMYPAFPKSMRSYPLKYYLNDLRKHLNVV